MNPSISLFVIAALFLFTNFSVTSSNSLYVATFEVEEYEQVEQTIKKIMGDPTNLSRNKQTWSLEEDQYNYKIVLKKKSVRVRYKFQKSDTPLLLKLERLTAELDTIT